MIDIPVSYPSALSSSRCFSAGVDNAHARFEDDNHGIFFLHDVDPPDENFKLLWQRVEKFQRFVHAVDVLDEWKLGGRPLTKALVDALILKLTSRMWYKEARKVIKLLHVSLSFLSNFRAFAQVVNWMFNCKDFVLTDRDELIHLDIVRRSDSRRAYEEVRNRFSRLQKKSETAYSIYLEACVSGHRLSAAEDVMNELFSSGLMETARPCNIMLKFYLRCGRSDKALALYKELESSGIAPDLTTYLILMRFRETFSSEQVEDKVEAVLESLKVEPENRRPMMKLYGYLGKREGVEAVWIDTRAEPPVRTADYLNALEAFDILGEVSRAEDIARELEQRTNGAGLHQLLFMLRLYARHGLTDKAKQMLRKMDLNGWEIDNRSLHDLVGGYLNNRDFDEALKQFQEGWRRIKCPSRAEGMVVETLVKLIEASAEKNDLEPALSLLKLVPDRCDVKLYKAVIHLSLKLNKPVFGLRRMMEDAGVNVDAECRELLEQVDRIVVLR